VDPAGVLGVILDEVEVSFDEIVDDEKAEVEVSFDEIVDDEDMDDKGVDDEAVDDEAVDDEAVDDEKAEGFLDETLMLLVELWTVETVRVPVKLDELVSHDPEAELEVAVDDFSE